MKTHPSFRTVSPHENADGSEPFGKQWNEVPLFARIGILMDALMASLQEILKLSDEQLTAFTADFEARLPKLSLIHI